MAQPLRVMSANLWKGAAEPAALADQVLALAVDVLAVQEATPEQADALSAVMPHGHLEPARDSNGMGILLRRPGELDRVPMRGRDGHVARLSPEQWPQLAAPVEVINLHFSAPHVFYPYPGLLRRPFQMRGLQRYLSSSPNSVRALVGDFNAAPFWPLYRRMSSQFTDAAVAVAETRGSPALPTWGPLATGPRLFRIDHGFVRGLAVEEFRVVDVLGSDHSAIVMDVSLS